MSGRTMSLDDFLDELRSRIPQKSAKEELDQYNILKEYDAIKKISEANGGFGSKYQEGRFKVLEYIINCATNEPINGDYFDPKNNQILKEAGKLLYEDSGMDGMHDRLVWAFVPKRYKGDINYMWNGIGDWSA